jgi:hypothetical protein
MFGISSDAAFGHARPAVDEADEAPAEKQPQRDGPAADVIVGGEKVADSSPVEHEQRGLGEVPAPDPGPAPAAPSAAEDSHADSVSAYMERLLARSRTAAANSAPPAAEPVRRRRSSTESPDDEETSGKPDSAPPPPPPVLEMPSAPPKTIAPEEREALRANIDSFRELANASARSAVAKHESKKLRTMVQIKVVLTIVAAALTVVLFTANSLGRVSYGWYVLASGLAAVVMIFDLARTVIAFYRWKSVETANLWEPGEEPSDDEPGAKNGASSAGDDDTTSELPITPAGATSTAQPDSAAAAGTGVQEPSETE